MDGRLAVVTGSSFVGCTAGVGHVGGELCPRLRLVAHAGPIVSVMVIAVLLGCPYVLGLAYAHAAGSICGARVACYLTMLEEVGFDPSGDFFDWWQPLVPGVWDAGGTGGRDFVDEACVSYAGLTLHGSFVSVTCCSPRGSVRECEVFLRVARVNPTVGLTVGLGLMSLAFLGMLRVALYVVLRAKLLLCTRKDSKKGTRAVKAFRKGTGPKDREE